MSGAHREGVLSEGSPLSAPGVLAALTRAESYPDDPSARELEHVQTHLSHVFLSGARVYKFRKPVDLGFVRFTTRALRDADCLREVALNRRLAPDVYLGVAPLRVDGGVRVGPPAEALAPDAPEHCVVMRRLPQGRDLLSLLLRGALAPEQLDRVARRIARFHDEVGLGAPAPYAEADWLAHCTRPALANFDALRSFAASRPDERSALARLERGTRDFAEQHAARFEARRRAGRAVDAHGDLHLQHVWLERDDAEPIAIDGLEFDAELRRIDAASEVAFLAMDLRYRGAPQLAERFLRVYASERDDFDLYRVVDWFESYRAAVRAKVAAIAADEAEIPAAQRALAAESAARHLALAVASLGARDRGALVLVGGSVGSGKSTLASALADLLGAAVVSSDRVRKHRLGLPARARAGRESYTPEARAAVYAALGERAEAVLASGRVAIVDATWGARRERLRALARAAAQRVPAFFVETTCAQDVAYARLAARERRGDDPSDAGPSLLATSRAGFEPPDEWPEAQRVAVATDAPDWRPALARVAERVRALRDRSP